MRNKKKKLPEIVLRYLSYMSVANASEALEYFNCDGESCNIVVNGPRALLCQGFNAQATLLLRLQRDGEL